MIVAELVVIAVEWRMFATVEVVRNSLAVEGEGLEESRGRLVQQVRLIPIPQS